jgi:hypothetical protein
MGNNNTKPEQEILNNNVNGLDKNDKIGISKYDDSYKKFETTITSIAEYKDPEYSNSVSNRFKIRCEPNYKDGNLYIYKDNPDFVNIHNKIVIGNTYNIIFKHVPIWGLSSVDCSVIDILPPTTNTLVTPIRGFINILSELSILDYHEVVTSNTNNKIRLLIPSDKKDDIIIGQTYYLTYVKAWKSNLYKVTNYELQ